jgi:AraC-like DNA-binding protein
MTLTHVVATPATSVLVPCHLDCGPNAGINLLIFESVVSLQAQLGSRPLQGLLVELRDDASRSSSVVVRELRATFPRCPIIAVVRALTRDRDLVPAAIAAGATDLALIGYEDLVSCVRRTCGGSGESAPEEEILRALQPHVDADVWPFMAYAIQTAARRLSVDQFAAAFGLSRSALSRRVRRHAFGSATALMMFARALVAAVLLQRQAARVTSVAHELRFRTPYAFRVFLRKQFNARPAEIRCGPGITHALERLVTKDLVLRTGFAPSRLLHEIVRGVKESDGDRLDAEPSVRSA